MDHHRRELVRLSLILHARRGVMLLSNVQRVRCTDADAALELLRKVRVCPHATSQLHAVEADLDQLQAGV